MDNYNALSKSAILTKLALDGYFIDLLTLNTFIKEWQIEAIYENEFGIEFFDNTSYLTILDNLKTKYNKNKPDEAVQAEISRVDISPKEINTEPEILPSESKEIIETETIEPLKEEEPETKPLEEIKTELQIDSPVDIDTLVKENEDNKDSNTISPDDASHPAQNEDAKKEEDSYSKSFSLEELAHSTTSKEEYEETRDNNPKGCSIMPKAMKNLTPGPVSPSSNINIDHSYIPEYNEDSTKKVTDLNKEDESMEADTMEPSSKGKSLIEYDDELMHILQGEDFTAEEIEKADKLIMAKKEESSKEEEHKQESENDSTDAKDSEKEIDLIQLAQSFAQNLTGQKEEKEIPPADLEKIFEESYTEPFEELKDYVQESNEEMPPVEEYKSLQEDLPSDIEAMNGQTISVVPANPASVQGISSYSNLTAENIREIIREEISRQTRNSPQIPNNDSIKNLVREIVKQTADVAPQNAFKLDISNRTLDLIAKAIAKKIAVKLNDYYKLNSSKQNAKLQMFRDKTIELKEKNQALNDENKKLRMLLLESNKNLNSYKPTIFGLFKFEGKKHK